MKVFKVLLGIIAVLVLLAVAVLGILAIWGIYPVSLDIIVKSAITLTIATIVLLLLWLFIALFFKKEKHRNIGNNAHPID